MSYRKMGNRKNKIPAGKVAFTIIYLLFFPALLLFLSGNWLWQEGWIFSAWFITLCTTSILYLFYKDPELLAERYRKPGTGAQKGWDRYVVIALFTGFIFWLVIMPLDAERFHWSPAFPILLKATGWLALLCSFFFFYRSFTDNTFLSPLVRIQNERKQKVISTGVYGFVRHPMYLAAILMFIGTPLLLESYLGIGGGLMITFLLAFRTLREEKMMLTELEGYEDYKQKVKYRFIPFIW